VTSAGLAAVPVPGVDVVLNLALICKELWLYHKTFGFEQQIVMDIIKADYISQKLTSSSIVKIGAANEAMQQFLLIELVYQFYCICFDKMGSNPQSNTLEMKEATITIPMRFLFNMIKLT
jgi:hypothetical protein